MRYLPLLSLGVIQCLFEVATAAQTIPPEPLSLQSTTSSIQPTTGAKTLYWQKAPDGVGELLVYPNPPGQNEFVWGKRRVLGTELGLLTKDAKGGWKILPSLYKASVRIAGIGQDLIWLEQNDDGLVALKKNLKIVQRLPNVKGRCIAIEKGGFWCLANFSVSSWKNSNAQELIEYDHKGQEKRRFVVKGLSLIPATTAPIVAEEKQKSGFGFGDKGFGYSFGGSGIAWAAVDRDAIWVSLNNYSRGVFTGGGFLRLGEEKLGRLERSTGQFTTLAWPSAQADKNPQLEAEKFLDLPERIQWLAESSGFAWDVYELDKRTFQINRVLQIDSERSQLKVTRDFIWVQKRLGNVLERVSLVYSRFPLAFVNPEKAGLPPERVMSYLSRPDFLDVGTSFWGGIVASNSKGVWLGSPLYSLVFAGDEGQLQHYNVRSVLNSNPEQGTFASEETANGVLWSNGEQLIRVWPNRRVVQLSLARKSDRSSSTPSYPFILLPSTSQRIWYGTSKGQLITSKPDFSAQQIIEYPSKLLPANSRWMVRGIDGNEGTIAVGDVLYMWDNSGHLLRIDGATGEVNIVESWTRYLLDYESHLPPERKLEGRNSTAFALPDGRIAFTFSVGLKHGGGEVSFAIRVDKAHFFIFDPRNDTWQESNTSTEIQPLQAGCQLYGYDAQQIYQWRGNGWQIRGKRPLIPPAQQTYRSGIRSAGTEKYYYAETPLGLYRVLWSQIGAQ